MCKTNQPSSKVRVCVRRPSSRLFWTVVTLSVDPAQESNPCSLNSQVNRFHQSASISDVSYSYREMWVGGSGSWKLSSQPVDLLWLWVDSFGQPSVGVSGTSCLAGCKWRHRTSPSTSLCNVERWAYTVNTWAPAWTDVHVYDTEVPGMHPRLKSS